MRAMLFEEYGGPEKLAIKEIPVPEPGDGEVRVRVRAFGINRAETYMRRGTWGDVVRVSGIECVGEVDFAPDGSKSTSPTHSIPLTRTTSPHVPLRMYVSARLMPKALTLTRTSPSPGSGTGISLIANFSGPPYSSNNIARIAVSLESLICVGLSAQLWIAVPTSRY